MPAPADARVRELRSALAREILLWALALLLAAGMIYYYRGVLIPIRARQSQRTGALPGNWSDLYPRWLGARELFLHGRNPYSPELTRDIQSGFYGRAIDPSNPRDPKDPEAFAYPLYVVSLLAPFVPLSFDSARIAFLGVLFVLTAVSPLLWMRALGLPLRRRALLFGVLATMSSFPVVDGLHLEQLSLLVAALMAASLTALAGGHLLLAGALLAVSMVKPQLTLLTALFLSVWVLGAWPPRKRFAIGFAGMMITLLIGSELLMPGWFRFWIEQMRAYVGYVKPPLLKVLLGETVSLLVAALAVLFCGLFFWRVRKEMPGADRFNFALGAALLVTIFLLPNGGGALYNQVLLVPVVIWLFHLEQQLTRAIGLVRFTWLLAVAVLACEWLAALAVSFAALLLHHNFQREATFFVAGPELLVFFFPVALAISFLSTRFGRPEGAS